MSPDRPDVTLVIDGIEVTAPEGEMLVDAAKHGDIEIPVFCYEPKLGHPVGACRMCMVEIEGIPKLQTACSTPVRDGMVVHTRTDRVIAAQNAVVEFLLVNHPLDCPVCDKGGECPLQDIAMGWGPGRSRYTDPKRHFQKPVPLSPLVRIDRERCILCYRCVRFSQEVAEDEQLQLLERGAATYVGTFDDRPYIAPFHGNIVELCPVGALTAEAYRFRARPWDIEDAGSICTLCPSQCNVKYTVRDERVQRVLARDNEAVDDGWLCDKGRFGFQMIGSPDRVVAPRVGGSEVDWETALDAVAERLRAAGRRTAAIVGGAASNEEGYLVQRIVRRALGSNDVTTDGPELEPELARTLFDPRLSAGIAAIDRAESVLVIGADPLHAMPILDLRLRKAIRRNGVKALIASERPTALDGGAEETARYAPGDAAAFLGALAGALAGAGEQSGPGVGANGDSPYAAEAERLAGELRPGATVIVWGERIGRGADGPAALAALARCAGSLRAEADGAGLIAIPDGANGRGLREVGCAPGAGPGLAPVGAGRDAAAICEALAAGELDAVLLIEADPIRELPGGSAWREALRRARTVVAVSMFEHESAAAADVLLPAESMAEKEGTVTHPDGRVQRLRPSVPHPGAVRPTWQVLAELAARLGEETGIGAAREALDAIAAEVPFYAGLTPEEVGGRGIRWQERPQAASFPSQPVGPGRPGGAAGASDEVAGRAAEPAAPSASQPVGPGRPGGAAGASDEVAGRAAEPAAPSASQPVGPGRGAAQPRSGGADGDVPALRLGTYRDLWATEVTERNVALRFLAPAQTLELAPADAQRLGIGAGDRVEVRGGGGAIRARAAINERIQPGAAFLIEGTRDDNANLLAGAATIEVTRLPDAEQLEVTPGGARARAGAAS